MAILTRDQIIAASDIPQKVIHVPEWGGDVIVRALKGTERDMLEAYQLDEKKSSDKYSNFSSRLLARVLVDEDGKRIFREADIAALAEKNAMVITRLFQAAVEISAMTQEDINDLTKN